MSLELPFGIKVVNPKPVDHYYDNDGTPYVDIAEANAAIPAGVRYLGMTVNISSAEYWYATGTSDLDLVPKVSGGAQRYTHVQGTGATVWNINHNLGRRVLVTVYDNAGNEWQGEINYVDSNNITITFAFALSGYAECS